MIDRRQIISRFNYGNEPEFSGFFSGASEKKKSIMNTLYYRSQWSGAIRFELTQNIIPFQENHVSDEKLWNFIPGKSNPKIVYSQEIKEVFNG